MVPAKCLRAPTALADVSPEAPRSFALAHEAFAKGRDLEASGDLAGAQRSYAEAVAADPTHGLVRLALAEVHWRTDNDTAAIRRHLAAAVVLLPENPRAHLRFADVSAEVGADAVAVTHWGCALELEPKLARAHVALARHHLGAGDPRSAERHVRAAIVDEPGDYRHHVLLAQALDAQGQTRDAAAEAAQAADLVGRSAPLFRRAADMYDRAGDAKAADAMRAKADTLDPPRERRDLRPLRKARRGKKRRGKTRR